MSLELDYFKFNFFKGYLGIIKIFQLRKKKRFKYFPIPKTIIFHKNIYTDKIQLMISFHYYQYLYSDNKQDNFTMYLPYKI